MNLIFILLQINQTVIDTTSGLPPVVTGEDRMSLLELLLKGGPLMVPLVIMSIIAVYIFIERYLTIKKSTKEEADFMKQIRDFVLNGNIEAAKSLCSASQNPIARMTEKGVSRIGKPVKNIEAAIEGVGKLEIYKLERSVGTLASIAGVAPMVGFLGTVTGMITAFYNLSKAGNNIETSMLAGGIYEALVTTVGGLVVGIFAMICYNVLVGMIGRVVYKMELTAMEFMDLLQEPAEKIN